MKFNIRQSKPSSSLESELNTDIHPSPPEDTAPTTKKPSVFQRPTWQYILLGLTILTIGGIAFQFFSRNTEVSETAITESARLPVRATRVKVQPLQQFVFGDGRTSAVQGIATAKEVRTQKARHPQWHLVKNQTAQVFCGFDFLTKTNIFQSDSGLENKVVGTTLHTLRTESVVECAHLDEMWHYPSPQPVPV